MADISKVKLSDGTSVNIKDATARESLDLKQDKTDDSLTTTNKTIVGAINELKASSGSYKSDFRQTSSQSGSVVKVTKFDFWTYDDTYKTNKLYGYWGGGSEISSNPPTFNVFWYEGSIPYNFITMNLLMGGVIDIHGKGGGSWIEISSYKNSCKIEMAAKAPVSNEAVNSLSTTHFIDIISDDGSKTYDTINLYATGTYDDIVVVQYQGVARLLTYNKEVADYSDNTNEVVNVAKLNDATNTKLKNKVYPVGSVYTTTSSDVLPDLEDDTITWEQIGSIEVNGVNIYFYRRTA